MLILQEPFAQLNDILYLAPKVIQLEDDFVTILTRTYIHEVSIPQSMLESEGIQTQIRDGNTVQAHPFYSYAIGGVKLQVRCSDYEKSKALFKDTEFEIVVPTKRNDAMDKFQKYSDLVPLLNRWKLELRLLVVVAIMTLFVALIILLFA
jgi:hypothetical protein